MQHYLPILKREISNDALVAFAKVRNVKEVFLPLLEVGHVNSTIDNKFVNKLFEVFDNIFIDYPYVRGQKEKGWNTDLKKDIVDYLKEISSYTDLDLKNRDFYEFKAIPVISEEEHFQDEDELIKHFQKVYQKTKEAGFKRAAFRVSFHHLEYVPTKLIEFIKQITNEDFIFIDSKVSQLTEKDSIPGYDMVLTDFVRQIERANSQVNTVILNSKFRKRTDDNEIVEHLHWPLLKDKLDIFGFGDYITELDSSGGGKSSGFNLSFYEFDTRLIRKFHSDNSQSDLFDKIALNEHVMSLIDQHKGYCKYCKKLKDSIDRREFDKEFLIDKGELERIHHLNSISVNEFNSPVPSGA